MVLDLPGVSRGNSSNVCALTLAKFLAEVDLSPCHTIKAPSERQQFLCPRAVNPVVFSVGQLDARRVPSPSTTDLEYRDIPSLVAWLRTVPVFRPLPASVLAHLSHRVAQRTYRDGDEILQKGHLGESFYILKTGVVQIVDYADQQISSVVTQLKERDCFGEMSLLTGSPCVATVAARGEVKVLALMKDDFDQLLRDNPYMASRFTRLLASRLMAANFLIVQEGAKSFSGKLSVMNLPTVLQVLANSSRSGTLMITNHRGGRGKIGFCDGQVYEAEVGPLTGEDAVFHTLTWNEGDFWLDPGAVPSEDNVNAGVMGLLMEGMRRIDESSR